VTARLINEVRKGFYLDSVALMRLSRHIAGMDGVIEAALMMGSPSNLQIMADAGLLAEDREQAGGGDLVIAISTIDPQVADSALQEARQLLEKPSRGGVSGNAWRPHTVESAVAALPGANLALISIAGDYAMAEARAALKLGMHVMIFSDNIALSEEVAVKNLAREQGLLVMGPDCGTAIINGTPLAFANNIPRGDTGIIGASGTGIQEVSCLIAHGGGGISHAIGVGGRDLSEAVGGITTLMALDVLDRDPGTRHIVIISKPPSPVVASRILQRIAVSQKTFTVCFVGSTGWPVLPGNVTFADTLKVAAESALGGQLDLPAAATTPKRPMSSGASTIRGLFSGGTLCAEAQVVVLAAGQPVSSNAPVTGACGITESDGGHRMLDLGDDEYTRGRPHPMIDPAVRDDAIIEALDDASVGVILLDLVLGNGAHENPAQHLHDLIAGRQTARMPVILASVTGTDDDPQQRVLQQEILRSANVSIAPSNADAAALALAHVAQSHGG